MYMNKLARKRRKGSGRKFADGRISKPRFIRQARKWFMISRSVRHFIAKTRISRQTYYRFLNKHPQLKKEIAESRKNIIKHRKEMIEWLIKNPDKKVIDYYFRNIGQSRPIVIENKPIVMENKYPQRLKNHCL